MKRRIGVPAVFLALIAVLVSACSFPGGGTGTPTRPIQRGNMQLAHAPTGTLEASWDPATSQATLKLSLVTSRPTAHTPSPSTTATVTRRGSRVRALPQLTADDTGAGTISDQFTANVNAVPTSGWYVAINNATGTDQSTARSSSHAWISQWPLPPEAESGNRQLAGDSGVGYSQYSTGNAELRLDGTTLTINMTAVNLEPGSTHPTYLYAGSCAAPGAQLFVPLKPLVADGNGSACATSTVVNVNQVPTGGWIIMSHRGTNLIEPDRLRSHPLRQYSAQAAEIARPSFYSVDSALNAGRRAG